MFILYINDLNLYIQKAKDEANSRVKLPMFYKLGELVNIIKDQRFAL